MSTDVWVDPAIIPWPSVWFYQMSALQKCGGYLELEFHRLWTVNQTDGSQGRKCFQKILQILFEFQDQNTVFLSYEDYYRYYRINKVTTKMIQYFQKPRTWSLSSDASMWVPVCVCHFSWSDSRYICGIQFSHSEQSLEKCLDFAPGLKASYLKHHMWKNPSYTLYFIQLLWSKTWTRCREAVMGCRSVLWKEKIKKKLNWIWASAHLPDRKTRPCEKHVLSVKRLLYKLLLSCRNTGSVIPFLLR